MKLKRMPAAEIKILGDEGNGRIEGYANVFGVVDSYGDVTMPGTFSRDLEEFIGSGYMTVDHDWSMKATVADIVEAKEDARGLWFAAEFYSDDESQAIRRKMVERQARGKGIELSIGYYAMEEEAGEHEGMKVNFLKRVKVREVSLVMAAANPDSLVTAVKSRAEEHGDLCALAGSYLERIQEIRELGRSKKWLAARADELRDLGSRYLSLADAMTVKTEDAPASDHGDDDAWALLAATGFITPTLTR